MGQRILLLCLVSALLLAAPLSALAQSVGDPCTGVNRAYTTPGSSSGALVCNGTTLELLEKDLSNPARKGIGTVNPATMFDVSGEAKIGNTGIACSGTTEGAMRYNGTSHELEYCNGTAWTSLSPAAGGSLKVYKSDGVTEVGNLIGSFASGCDGIAYADSTTGEIKSLNATECATTASAGCNAYFSGANCTGTAYVDCSGVVEFCCTGAADCTTNPCISVASVGSITPASRRNSSGVCSSYTFPISLYSTRQTVCSGKCVVK